jgi:hypothetical protein
MYHSGVNALRERERERVVDFEHGNGVSGSLVEGSVPRVMNAGIYSNIEGLVTEMLPTPGKDL